MSDQMSAGVEALSALVWKTPEETATHILQRIDEATRDTDRFVQWDGATIPW
jgi:hypothetical protein